MPASPTPSLSQRSPSVAVERGEITLNIPSPGSKTRITVTTSGQAGADPTATVDGDGIDITFPSNQPEGTKHVIVMNTGIELEQPFVPQRLFPMGTPVNGEDVNGDGHSVALSLDAATVSPPSSLIKKLTESAEEDKEFQAIVGDFNEEQLHSTLALFFSMNPEARVQFAAFARTSK